MPACATCGSEAPGEARFCSQCGARLGDASVVIEPDLRDEVLTSLRAEHRLCTVVFADLTASVRRTRDLDAEGATALVNPLLETMVELMVRHGGRIDRFLGDGLLAVFGVPAAHEDDPIRAVRAGVELRERAAELGLEVTIGINTGRVYFGPVGSSLHEELTVMGPVVNLAARMQGTAGPSEVIIGAATQEHVRAAFDLRPLTLDIKGMDQPVAAFSVERLARNPDKVRGIEGLTAGLVGRSDELATLIDSLATERLIAVVGEAGLGKSRIARELHAHHGGTWIEGRCAPLTQVVPFSGLVDALRSRFGDWDGLDARLEELGLDSNERSEIDAFLRHLLMADPEAESTEPALRRRLTIGAIGRWLAAEAALGPTVLFLDDIQWADPLTTETITALAARTDGPTIVVASRPDPGDALARLDGADAPVTTVRLRPLTDDQVIDLVRQLLTVSELPAERETALVSWAGGNPFYVEELIRSLIQRRMIELVDDRWQPTDVTIELELPESIEGLVMSRYDRLDTPARKAGQVAAVLDRPFDDRLFRAVAGDLLAGELETLRSGDFVRTIDGTWSFSHDLVKEAVYASLLPSQRRDLHHSVAEAFGTIDPENHEALAFHYERTENHAAAVEHLLAAARRATDEFANDTAAGHIARGLERLELIDEDRRLRHGFLLLRAQLAERAGEYRSALADLRSAHEMIAPDGTEAANIWRLTGRVHRLLDDPSSAFEAFDRAEQILDQQRDADAWVALQVDVAVAMYFGGRARELPGLIERVGPRVERHGTPAQRAELLGFSALHSFINERFRLSEETLEVCRRAAALAAAGNRRRQLSDARFRLGFSLVWADRVQEAVGQLEQALADARHLGDVMAETRAASYLAIALRRCGRVDAAAEAGSTALEIAERLGDTYYQGHAHAVIGWARWRRGQNGEAERMLTQAIELWGPADRDGERFANVEFCWLAAWPLCAISHERGDPVGAVGHLTWLAAPWERPMGDELARAVERARADPSVGVIASALALAEAERLL